MRNKLKAIGIACATAVLAGGLLSAGASAAEAAPPSTSKKQLTYVVAPHPDDVYEAWSLVQGATDNYPVFVTFTKGEASTYCRGQSVPVDGYGSYTTPQWEAGCKNARMASLNSFLDKKSQTDSTLDPLSATGYRAITTPASTSADGGAPTAAVLTSCAAHNIPSTSCSASNGKPVPWNGNNGTSPTGWTLRVGPKSARAEFDLGDGNLTDAEVKWAIAAVRAQRGINIPSLPEYAIIGASYSNLYNGAAWQYKHHDHRAVSETLYNGGFGINTLGATYLSDPDANAFYSYPYSGGNGIPAGNGTNTDRRVTSYYSDMSGNTSSGGAFQKSFGWLTGDAGSPTAAWPICANNMGATTSRVFCEQQAFTLRR